MKILLLLPWLAGALVGTAVAADRLERGFLNPPPSARPWVYWFPLDGNLSSNGITLDLEAMARVGIGGVLYMETDQGAPRGPAAFAGPLWRDLFKHICAESHRLGLEVNMNNDAGWCGSGGPWITPELSMQRVIWSETNVTGPIRFQGALPQAPAVANYYRDIAVFAFPTPASNYVIPHLRGKSAAVREEIPARAAFATLGSESVITRGRLVDLTAQLGAGGRLTWDVPAGSWTLLRLGHTTTGKDNHPAPLSGRGLECDKLSKEAAEFHFNELMGKLIADNQKLTGEKRTLISTHIDSWEVGSQNWTPRFREDFQRLRGYDPVPFLPVMSGRVVDSLEVSERFLWDVRQTVNDLLVDNYAGHFRTLAHRHGLRLSIEAYDGVPCDDLTYAGRADEPMGEFWSYAPYSGAHWCTEMASAAHVYGRPILGAEAFTATDAEKWLGHPGSIKAMGDWAFCEGINRFVFHRYALQPWDDRRPGMSMGPWGLHYERTQTWWEQSKAWHLYLARCQFLLQQGRFVADLCFLAPEMSPQRFKSPVKSGLDRPGYNFDGCPPEVVLSRMKVKDGRLTLPDGMNYRALVLPQVPTVTPTLLRKIRDLVHDGATVVGVPPIKSPSLQNYPQCDAEVKSLALELWGKDALDRAMQPPSETGTLNLIERRVGKGRVVWGPELSYHELPPDTATPLAQAKWIWRKEGNPAHAAPATTRYFRRLFALETTNQIQSGRLVLTADNAFECWVNGRRAGSGDNFGRTYLMNVAPLLRPGTNVLAVSALNATDSPNPAGLIGLLTIQYTNGNRLEIRTDQTWQASPTAPPAWTTTTAGHNAWETAMELGPLGMEPWGHIEQGLAGSDPTPDIQILTRWLASQGVPPDFAHRSDSSDQPLRYIHKLIGRTDVYFVANKNPHPESTVCAFRVGNKRPELWWPESGRVEQAAVYDTRDGVVWVPIQFQSHESVFVIFRSRGESDRITSITRNTRTIIDAGEAALAAVENKTNQIAEVTPIRVGRTRRGALEAEVSEPGTYQLKLANGRTREVVVSEVSSPVTVTGPWTVHFDPQWGGPSLPVRFDTLENWAKRPEPGVKYYSGTARYQGGFQIAALPAPNTGLFLDLGKVAVSAEVKLNGKNLGILWKAPFRVEITDAIKLGTNLLEVDVVNLWVNRQIGDEQLPEDSTRNPNGTLKAWPQWLQEGKPSPAGRYTFTSWRLWKKESALQESGWLGPVTLQSHQRVRVGR